MLKDLLTTDQAAEALGHSRRTLELWRQRGEGPPFYYIGRKVFYRRADLVEWVDSRRAESVDDRPGAAQ